MATALPNPETPLAFLPPTLASQLEVSRYLLVATCGMFSWDMLINLRNDFSLLTQHRIGITTLVYFLSRLTSFAYIISSTVFMIGPVGNCQTLQVALGWAFAVAVASTSLLFFIRVRAIFADNYYVIGLFALCWLAVAGGASVVPFAISGGHIGPTDHCINTAVKPFSSAGIIASTANDTLVFLFISFRLLRRASWEDRNESNTYSFFRGSGLPAFSRSLLQSGQEYYLITVIGNIVTFALILAPASLPVMYHAIATVPNVAVSNAMACRVYRDIRFGLTSATVTSSQRSTVPSTRRRDLEGNGTRTFGSGAVHISKTVHEARDDAAWEMSMKFPEETRSSASDLPPRKNTPEHFYAQ